MDRTFTTIQRLDFMRRMPGGFCPENFRYTLTISEVGGILHREFRNRWIRSQRALIGEPNRRMRKAGMTTVIVARLGGN